MSRQFVQNTPEHSGRQTHRQPLAQFFTEACAISHLRALTTGEIGVKDLLYFASLTVLGLFLAQRTVESQRWS